MTHQEPWGTSKSPSQVLADWAGAVRANQTFSGVAAGLLTVGAFMLFLGLHGETYRHAGVPGPVAYPGAIVAGLLVLGLLAALTAGYPELRTRWGRWVWLAVALMAVVTVAFALLPPVANGDHPLTIFLFALVTVVYDVLAAGYLAAVRPWEAIRRTAR